MFPAQPSRFVYPNRNMNQRIAVFISELMYELFLAMVESANRSVTYKDELLPIVRCLDGSRQ